MVNVLLAAILLNETKLKLVEMISEIRPKRRGNPRPHPNRKIDGVLRQHPPRVCRHDRQRTRSIAYAPAGFGDSTGGFALKKALLLARRGFFARWVKPSPRVRRL
jgi:hypothetical protein